MSTFCLPPHGDDTFTLANTCCYSWGSAEPGEIPVGMADTITDVGHSSSDTAHMLASQRTTLGKRPRSDELTGNGVEELKGDRKPRPLKKVKGKTVANGVLEAAGSTSRARHKSATKTPVSISCISEAVGRGAGRLAAPNAHEVYHQFLPGPSVRELAGTTALGKPPRIVGSEQEATRHYASVVAQRQVLRSNSKEAEEDEEGGHFQIPKRLSQRHRSFLAASSEDLERHTVKELKCRLCPRAGFSNWEDFKRHCDVNEAHPLEIWFCQYCGDFFARKDALKRHEEKRPRTCYNVSQAEAEVKRTATKQAHDAFPETLEKCLGSSGETWEPFSKTITDMFPKSSKRGSRQQCRITAPKS